MDAILISCSRAELLPVRAMMRAEGGDTAVVGLLLVLLSSPDPAVGGRRGLFVNASWKERSEEPDPAVDGRKEGKEPEREERMPEGLEAWLDGEECEGAERRRGERRGSKVRMREARQREGAYREKRAHSSAASSIPARRASGSGRRGTRGAPPAGVESQARTLVWEGAALLETTSRGLAP